jgi:copper chaperone NosL
MRLANSSILAFALMAGGACARDVPRAIVEGEDNCTQCHMGVAELRFAAQARTATGKVLIFDSVECLARHVAEAPAGTTWRGLHVTDHDAPGSWLPVESARFLADGTIASPMGMRLAAFAAESSPDALTSRYEGRVVDWHGVLELVRAADAAALHGAVAPHQHEAMP